MAVWRCGGVAVWRCGGVAVWRCGGVAVWQQVNPTFPARSKGHLVVHGEEVHNTNALVTLQFAGDKLEKKVRAFFFFFAEMRPRELAPTRSVHRRGNT